MDKKGILSWPNPSAEKICFLTPESQREAVNEEEDQGFSNSCDKIQSHPEVTEKHPRKYEIFEHTNKLFYDLDLCLPSLHAHTLIKKNHTN